MSAHTPSAAGAGCADSCVPCELARAREIDALRDLRALVLRVEERNGFGSASVDDWLEVVDAARKAVRP